MQPQERQRAAAPSCIPAVQLDVVSHVSQLTTEPISTSSTQVQPIKRTCATVAPWSWRPPSLPLRLPPRCSSRSYSCRASHRWSGVPPQSPPSLPRKRRMLPQSWSSRLKQRMSSSRPPQCWLRCGRQHQGLQDSRSRLERSQSSQSGHPRLRPNQCRLNSNRSSRSRRRSSRQQHRQLGQSCRPERSRRIRSRCHQYPQIRHSRRRCSHTSHHRYHRRQHLCTMTFSAGRLPSCSARPADFNMMPSQSLIASTAAAASC